MRAPRSARQTHNRAAAVHVPVRRAQTRERRNEIDISIVRNLLRNRLRLGRLRHQLHLVAQPLHHRAADEYAALERVARLPVHAPADRRDQIVLRAHRILARVHQNEAARAIGVFAHAGCKTALTEQRRMLIARQRRNRDLAAENLPVQIADYLRGIDDLRKQLRRNVHRLQELVVPALLVNVVKHRARRVGRVGHVHVIRRQVPGEEAVDRAEAELAVRRALARAGNGIQHPLQLRSGEIRIRNQAGLVAQHVAQAVVLQPLHQRRGAAALPHDRIAEGLAGRALPEQRGFALIGDADGRNIVYVDPRFFHRELQRVQLTVQNVLRTMLHPAGLGINLRKFNAVRRDQIRMLVEHDGARAGRSLIQRYDILHFSGSSFKINNGSKRGLRATTL